MTPVRWRERRDGATWLSSAREWWEFLWDIRWFRWLLGVVTVVGLALLLWKGDSTGPIDVRAEYQVLVVNAIPKEASDEEEDNSEPFLAVNPQNPDEMVLSAHMLGWGGFCDAYRSAVLRSLDRGRTWGIHCALVLNDANWSGDMSFAFSGDGTTLYGGLKPGYWTDRVHLVKTTPGPGHDWPVQHLTSENDPNLRDAHMAFSAVSSEVTTDVVAIGIDAMHVNNCNTGVVFWNVGSPANFSRVCVANRSSPAIEGPWTPVVRTAVHSDGTVYAATLRVYEQPDYTGGRLDVVVFRHDKGVSTATPFISLKDTPVATTADPCVGRDGQNGYRVVRCVPVPFDWLEGVQLGDFGQERRLWTSLALAVDPTDSKHLFVAWGDTAGPTERMTLHVRESTDGGQSWSSADLVTVTRALNPALAVSAERRLGFSYQRLDGSGSSQKWNTEVQVLGTERPPTVRTYKLATIPASQPVRCIVPYLGDFMNLVSIGNDFFGAFSTSSDVTGSNFPEGLATPARNAPTAESDPCSVDPENGELSIDPYFFAIERVTGTPGGSFLLKGVLR